MGVDRHGRPSAWSSGGILGLIQGFIVSYLGVPSFIVTLGGLLVWRGLIFQYVQGQTLAPMDPTFRLLGGGPPAPSANGRAGSSASSPASASSHALFMQSAAAAALWVRAAAHVGRIVLGALACVAVLGAVWVANSYFWPTNLANQYAERDGIPIPPGGLTSRPASPIPVLILLVVGLLMTYIATRRRFGRNVYAIGGNPEAAVLSGINVKRTIMYTFGLMGLLAAVSAVVQTARLNAAVTGLGVSNELDVISAAVIGGTSFAGGIGTIPGAILGAVVMQSLRSGMLLLTSTRRSRTSSSASSSWLPSASTRSCVVAGPDGGRR